MFPLKDENPVRNRTWMTWLLIAINIVVFIGPQGTNSPQRVDAADLALEWAAIPCEIVTGEGITTAEAQATFSGRTDAACDADPVGPPRFPDKPVRLAVIFSMFMHAGWMHLGGNVWFLFIFGNNIEDHLGPFKFLAFYLAGGIAATAAHVAVQVDSTIPVVGASGAVAAVMGAYVVWFPNAPIRTLIFIILWSVRAKWWLGFWFVSQFFIGADSGVAWMAHVGGFVFGALIGLLVRRSLPARNRTWTASYRDGADQPRAAWDSTGGAGRGHYPTPHRLSRR